MKNEKLTMNNVRKSRFFSLFILPFSLFIFLSCEIFELPRQQGGEGMFTLNIEGVSVGRTILPTTTQGTSWYYTLVFSASGKDAITVDRSTTALNSEMPLPVGTWNLTVTAYTTSARTIPIARGTLENIVIKGGATTEGSLELKAIIEAGTTGTFSWTITYPAETTVAGMTITPLSAGGTPEETLYFLGGTPSINRSSNLTLNTGFYRVVLSLSNGSHETGREEILHVYQNMESKFTFTFTQDHFTVYSVTNGEDSGPGSLRHALTNAAANSTILIENGVETINLKSRLSISKNLIIKGNGVTLTRDPSWTESNSSQLLYVDGTSITVTISRVWFKDGRATTYGAAIRMGNGNLTLESCIFSGNRTSAGNAYGGAIYCSVSTLTLKGCTFYGNISGNTTGLGGAIYFSNGGLTMSGNLFYGNNNGNGNSSSTTIYSLATTITSQGYNVVDAPLGTGNYQSGWIGASTGTDRTVSSQPIGLATLKPISGSEAVNVIASLPVGYPREDFYGTPINNGAAAGAIQATVNGYLFDWSVNDATWGSVSVTPQPSFNTDGLCSGGTFTVTAHPVAGFKFDYWLKDGVTAGTSNFLTFTLTAHTSVRAFFEGVLNDQYVKRIKFSGPTATVNFTGLTGNTIYLVKVNTSNVVVDAADTGSSPNGGFDHQSPISSDDMFPLVADHVQEFNANPPPIVDMPRRTRAIFVPPVVGDTRNFWVEQYYGNGVWVEKQATLRATGQYGNIWVMDENYSTTVGSGNHVTTAQAQALSAKFDLMYPAETNLLGYEYGGGPGGDGGKDGDPKVQILLYDIVNAADVVQAAGFFWSKDYYEQSSLTAQKTNLAEIFYIDASQVNTSLESMYSTLAHEFQHMIHFNVKNVQKRTTSESWYNEMLSMMTQDVIEPLIGVTSLYSVRTRIRTFVTTYDQIGITEWSTLGSSSYAKGYAFGAYLLRNYGGPEILRSLIANNTTNEASITQALNEFSPGMNFDQALLRFGEALVFNASSVPEDIMTYNRTISSTINGTAYTTQGFDLWSINGGPTIFDLTPREMRPHSVTVHSINDWKNKTGNLSITLDKPSDPNIVYLLMVK